MLEPTFKTLPDQSVLCATERGMVDNHMSAAAEQAFARLRAGAAALGVMEQVRGALGITPDMPTGPNDPDVRFVAAFVLAGEAPAGAAQQGLSAETVAAGRWAVFRHVGAYDTLWKSWHAIYREWLPASGQALRPQSAPYERYETMPGEVLPEQHITDIHIPIV
jgi:AraC family transcriptional regulator